MGVIVVVHVCSSDDSRPDMDEVSMLTAITLFLLSASSELVGVTVLQKGCIDRFKNALNSSDPMVRGPPLPRTPPPSHRAGRGGADTVLAMISTPDSIYFVCRCVCACVCACVSVCVCVLL